MKTRRRPAAKRSRGALLIGLIVVIALFGFLGATLVTLSSGTVQMRVLAGECTRAQHLAESGISIVKSMLILDATATPVNTYRLLNNDEVDVRTTRSGGEIRVRSTGIVNAGSVQERRHTVNAIILAPLPPEVVPAGFDLDEDGSFDDPDWNKDGPGTVDMVAEPGNDVVEVSGEEIKLSLNWQDNPDLDLEAAWANNANLLSYQMQVKIRPFAGSPSESCDHFLVGPVFRFRSRDLHYGVSYFHSRLVDDGNNPLPAPAWLPPELDPYRGPNVHIIIWLRDGATFEVLSQRRLLPTDTGGRNAVGPIITQTPQRDLLNGFSTLVLRLDERFGARSVRENALQVEFVSQADYPAWNSVADMIWWFNRIIYPPLTWDAPAGQVRIYNPRINSEDFNLSRPDEVGVHAFFDDAGGRRLFLDDFVLRMGGFTSPSGIPSHLQF